MMTHDLAIYEFLTGNDILVNEYDESDEEYEKDDSEKVSSDEFHLRRHRL